MPHGYEIAVTRSVIAAEALAPLVEASYDLAPPVRCRLRSMGDNDTYLVTADDSRYALRIYRFGKYWLQNESDYRFELDWLAFLHTRGVPVSYPIARRDGEFLGTLCAPEGTRYWALFSFAEGRIVRPLSREQGYLFGQKVAELHLASNEFVSRHQRLQVDLDFLLDGPVARIRAFLGDRRLDDLEFVAALAEQLKERILGLGISGDGWGIIGCDFHGGNNHITENNELTFFDFDLCGYGWRAYDLAVFVWGTGDSQQETRDAFLEGYQSVRRLSEAEQTAIPLFVMARQIWIMGSHTTYVDIQGDGWLNDSYWDRMIGALRKLHAGQ